MQTITAPTQSTPLYSQFHQPCEVGLPGDNAGVLLRGVKREAIRRGMVLVAPGSVTPHRTFRAQLYVLTEKEGGRKGSFRGGYSPQFFFRTTDVTGAITLVGGAAAQPGEFVEVQVALQKPVAMEEQTRFAVREGGKTVASGSITAIDD